MYKSYSTKLRTLPNGMFDIVVLNSEVPEKQQQEITPIFARTQINGFAGIKKD